MPDQFTRAQIRDRLTAFVARWSQRPGDEKPEAQTFLGELLDCYDTGWRDKQQEVRFEHRYPAGGFADLLWKGNVVAEMKSKYTTEKLPETHWQQLFEYWDRSSFPDEGMGAPRYALLCSYAMGVLLSSVHSRWAWAQSSTLKGDLRYTPTTVFATFPWPAPTDGQREGIADIAKRLIALRDELSVDRDVGLTKLYNACDEGMHTELRELHEQLDRAVAEAYGWPASVLSDPAEITARLLALNVAIAEGNQPYAPFPPLAPPEEPQSDRLFTPDGEMS